MSKNKRKTVIVLLAISTVLLLILLLKTCGSHSNTYVYPPTFVYQNARYKEEGSKADKVPEGYISKGVLKDNADQICDWSGKSGEEKYGNWELFILDDDPHQDVWLKDPETGDYVLWSFEFTVPHSSVQQQSRSFGSLIGQFVLRCFQGLEELKLPDDLRTLCVNNDEMDYVLQRQQYLIDATLVMGGGQIRNLSLTDVELKELEILSDEQVRVKAYVKLSFFYKDDATQTPTGAGLEVTADLRKAANEQYLVENYEELSSDYASMKEDYRRFCEEERKHGASDARELTERYFAQRLEQLSAAVNDK